ncbi:hypothetical protein KAFR_0A03980 [Kazachstania africana CBS 2517]|uniref:Transferrin receptor-like dimerisation domain-containing protein n=1 Tax=Kazachstania africana (strain ATCC 22294 / BCRC 22015 / CBS 2517 / CECT 1963 / NBRC 1671 / NRRL Y-8276) TaxID=1071382 RepID=H2AN83_KAZAF|nr:hypothetical protein KAFR_0A03980 [Kazachstania africana CBS 2517]CCF55833.1 hypothetical protein KAFR_0A03980 [Kazachstania africana CBS 2517]
MSSGGFHRLCSAHDRTIPEDVDSIDLSLDLDEGNVGVHPDFANTELELDIDLEDPLANSMHFEESYPDGPGINTKIKKVRDVFIENVVIPLRDKVIYPTMHFNSTLYSRIDYGLDYVYRPLPLQRLFYICLMCIITFFISRDSNLNNSMNGSRQYITHYTFSEHHSYLNYTHQTIDLAKFETDLEYLFRIPHRSGTKGDLLIKDYLTHSFKKNQLGSVEEFKIQAYANYPDSTNSSLSFSRENDEILQIDLNDSNFSPLTMNGYVENANLLYGNKGTFNQLKEMEAKGLLDDDFVLLLDYDIVVSEQILLAQNFGAKGVLFISDASEDNDAIDGKPAGISQFHSGDVLSPNWSSSNLKKISLNESTAIAQIPVLPLSHKQGLLILSELSEGGVLFDNGRTSGVSYDVTVNLNVSSIVKERQASYNVIGKIEGREQSEKGIIVAASRLSNFGTACLLSLCQILQQIKFKYDWIPLRNIYLISFAGTEFNFAGSTEFFEFNSLSILKEIYSFVDISKLGLMDEMKIQSHPLLQTLFKEISPLANISLNDTNVVHEYGDWTPFMANGIPVTVLSSVNAAEDFGQIHYELKDPPKQEALRSLLVFVADKTIQLANNPIIPFDVANYVDVVTDMLQTLETQHHTILKFTTLVRNMLKWKKISSDWKLWIRYWSNAMNNHRLSSETRLVATNRWSWNIKMSNIGKHTVNELGLPFNREFYKNVMFGPPLWHGNVAENWFLPSLQDALLIEDYVSAQEQIESIGKALDKASTTFIDEANNVKY